MGGGVCGLGDCPCVCVCGGVVISEIFFEKESIFFCFEGVIFL